MRLPKPANDNPVFLTIRQVAERWQVDEKSVRRLIERGELLEHRLGQQTIRISMADLVIYERLRQAGTSGVNRVHPCPSMSSQINGLRHRREKGVQLN